MRKHVQQKDRSGLNFCARGSDDRNTSCAWLVKSLLFVFGNSRDTGGDFEGGDGQETKSQLTYTENMIKSQKNATFLLYI